MGQVSCLVSVSGVAKRITNEQSPFCVPMHCAAHRISLVCDAFDKNASYAAIEKFLKASFNIFNHSNKNHLQFKWWQEFLRSQNEEQERTLKMKRIHDVRWLSIFPVLDGAVKEWDALLMFVHEKHRDEGALSVYKAMRDASILLGCRAVRPLLFRLNLVVKLIQGRDFMFEDLSTQLRDFRSFVTDVYVHPREKGFAGPGYQRFISVDGSNSPLKWLNGEVVYQIEGMEGVTHHVMFNDKEVTPEIWEGEVLPHIRKQVKAWRKLLSMRLSAGSPP